MNNGSRPLLHVSGIAFAAVWVAITMLVLHFADKVRELWPAGKLMAPLHVMMPQQESSQSDTLFPQLITDINGEQKRASKLGFVHFGF